MEKESTGRNQETQYYSSDVNADSLTNVAAAAASLDIDLQQQETYSQVSQQTTTTTTTTTTHSPCDHSCFQPDMCALGVTLDRAKQLQDGQVPQDLHCNLAATKMDDSDLNNDMENDMNSVSKQDRETGINCSKHGNQAKQCASMSTPTTDATQHQQLQDAAVMPTLTVLPRPPRPLVQPALAKDSVRRYYVLPRLQATASRMIVSSVISSLSRQTNVVNNESSAQPEDLLVAVPVEEDEVHVYAVSHDVTQHEVHMKLQMVQVRRISCRLYFIVFLLVAVAAMITSIVVIMTNKNDGQEQETETTMTWLQNMTQLIVSIMGADAVLLKDASSPYAKALTWLLQSSERNNSQEMSSTLAQRFYAASFYFDTTTEVDKWTDCNPPTNSSSELDQTCNGTLYELPAQVWLSDSHECEWYGVRCDSHLQITSLELDNMNLVGTIPSCTAKFPFLQVLVLQSSRLEGSISLLSNCPHLTHIRLSDNLLSGDLSSVWQHRKLVTFSVYGNHLTGNISSQIGDLVDLNILSLFNNELTGTVPSEVGQLDSIAIFDFSYNHFRGKLPPSMQFWSTIQRFYVSRNSFSGSIPTFLGQLNKTLQYLDLYDNSFTGTLPDELFHLSELITLDVSNNELRGTLDARFAQLTSLQWNKSIIELGLSGNHFTGTIPTELGLLTDLNEIYLQGNDFTGSVPASVCQNGFFTSVYVTFLADCANDNNGQAELQCDCCTSCCQADGTHCVPK